MKAVENKPNFVNKLLLPMIGINNKLLPTNFVNAYVTLEHEIVLVFDLTEANQRFDYFIDSTKSNKFYKTIKEDTDELAVFYEIKTEEEKENFKCFLEGRYSEFTESYKKQIISFQGVEVVKNDHKVTPYNVIYPLPSKRRQIAERLFEPHEVEQNLKYIKEVLDPPDLTAELYKPIQQLLESTTISNYEQKQ